MHIRLTGEFRFLILRGCPQGLLLGIETPQFVCQLSSDGDRLSIHGGDRRGPAELSVLQWYPIELPPETLKCFTLASLRIDCRQAYIQLEDLDFGSHTELALDGTLNTIVLYHCTMNRTQLAIAGSFNTLNLCTVAPLAALQADIGGTHNELSHARLGGSDSSSRLSAGPECSIELNIEGAASSTRRTVEFCRHESATILVHLAGVSARYVQAAYERWTLELTLEAIETSAGPTDLLLQQCAPLEEEDATQPLPAGSPICVACLSALPDRLLSPCCHLCLCRTCCVQLVQSSCPICRAAVDSVIPVFISTTC